MVEVGERLRSEVTYAVGGLFSRRDENRCSSLGKCSRRARLGSDTNSAGGPNGRLSASRCSSSKYIFGNVAASTGATFAADKLDNLPATKLDFLNMKTLAVIAAVSIILICALRVWHPGAAESLAPDSLCATYVGPAFIFPDESRSTIALRAGTATDVTFLSLDTGHTEGARIPVRQPVLAASIQQAAGKLLLALSDGTGVRISRFDLVRRSESSEEFFDHIDAQLAVFVQNGNYLFGVTAKGFIFKVDILERKVETLKTSAAIKASSLAVSQDGARLYVAGSGLTIVDAKSMRIESELAADQILVEVSASPDGHTLALRNLNSIELLDLGKENGADALASTVVDPMPNGASISTIDRLVFSQDGSTLFYIKASDPSPELLSLSTNDLRILARMPIGPRPNAIAIVPDRGWILLTAGHTGHEKLTTVDIKTQKVVFESALSGSSPSGTTGADGCSKVRKDR